MKDLPIYFKNTLSGQLEEFKPVDSGNVGMYTCGPTVYGNVHIGNLRAYVFADLVRNTLIYNGYDVKQITNITDVGHLVSDEDEGADKVEEQAKKESLDAKVITQKYTDYFMSSLVKLEIETKSTQFPKASENIPEQIRMIETLFEKEFAYIIDDGVYFDTSKFPEYGELGNINIKGLKEGARVNSNSQKKNSTDFALWKFSKEKRLQEWKSPWGVGFPGWHIECSAMASKFLGDTFDIHTGGVDHIPTHHNNEIAQSVAIHDKPLANYWLHVNHITIDGKKISKSTGNTAYLEDLETKGISPLDYKYWLYTSHYSTLSNFTYEAVIAAQKGLNSIRQIFSVAGSLEDSNYKVPIGEISRNYLEKFIAHINNNLDTPKAIALTHQLLSDKRIVWPDKRATILEFDKVLKLDLSKTVEKVEVVEVVETISSVITDLAQKRQTARADRDYAKADALREEIENQGYMIRDTDDEVGYKIDKK